MTPEEAIKNLYAIRTVYQMDLSEPEDRALAMAIQALEAVGNTDRDKTELKTELAELDRAVSLNAVIDEIRSGQSYITKISPTGELEHLFDKENRALEEAVERVMELPSVGRDTNVLTTDYISRQAAMQEITKYANTHSFNAHYKGMLKARDIIENMPSVSQPNNKPDISSYYGLRSYVGREDGES